MWTYVRKLISKSLDHSPYYSQLRITAHVVVLEKEKKTSLQPACAPRTNENDVMTIENCHSFENAEFKPTPRFPLGAETIGEPYTHNNKNWSCVGLFLQASITTYVTYGDGPGAIN